MPSTMRQIQIRLNYNYMLNNFSRTLRIFIPRLIFLQPYSHISTYRINHAIRFKCLRTVSSFAFCSKFSLKDYPKTFQLLVARLKSHVVHAEQLQKSLATESSSFDSKNKEQLRIQLAQLTPIRNMHDQVQSYEESMREIQQMISQTKDQSEKKLLQEELSASQQKLEDMKEEIWDLLIPSAKYDKASDIILEFRPGAGGTESCIFVKDISSMYEAYCSNQGWKCWTTTAVKESGVAGYKALDMRVQGEGAHKVLKSEAGVHKVIRIPETEAKGRLHSSTISLVVMPVVPFAYEVDPKDIKYQFTKSSGPGGQAVNKIQSACRATHIPTGLQVFIQEERSQDMNKKRATELLKQRLFEIEYRKSVEEEQSRRKSQVTTMDRSEKIRTYNYPQDRITDHRTALTKFGISAMMSGEYLEEFYEAYNQNVKQEKINALIEELYDEAGLPIPKK